MTRGRSQLLTTGNFRDWHTVFSTDTAAPCPGDIGGPSEQAYTRPATGRPARASAAQYAVDVTVLDHTSWCQ